jgi:hypothetical protein
MAMAKGLWRPAPRRRTILAAMGFCALLSGCTTTPDWAPWSKPLKPQSSEHQPAVPELREPAPRPHHRARTPRHTERKRAKEPEVAMLDPGTLVGMKPQSVAHALGEPAAITKEDLSLVWTYRADGCALNVYFYPDIKTSDFHVLKFSLAGADGKTLDANAPCRRKLLALREHDTG